MRKFLYLTFILAISCKSDDNAPASSFSGSPDAAASEDAKSGGIYKGVIVGSSGFFAVVLQKGQMKIRVTLDGTTQDLITSALPTWVSGEPIKNALFEAGDWQATFSVGAAGNSPTIQLNIPGHTNTTVALFKELSTLQVRAYEGTYSGSTSGSWNFIVQGPALTGIRSADGSPPMTFYGLVNENEISLDIVAGSGTFSGDNASGTWEVSGGGAGTWTAKRTM
jgi:hypothetical protein